MQQQQAGSGQFEDTVRTTFSQSDMCDTQSRVCRLDDAILLGESHMCACQVCNTNHQRAPMGERLLAHSQAAETCQQGATFSHTAWRSHDATNFLL